MAQVFERRENGFSNCYKLTLKPEGLVYRYDVDILGDISSGRTISLVDAGRARPYGYMDEVIAYNTLTAAFHQTEEFGHPSSFQMVFDNRNTLFTNIPIDERFEVIHLVKNDYREMVREFLKFSHVTVVLKFNTVLKFNDSRFFSTNYLTEDHDLRKFLEMLTTQPLLDSAKYFKTSNSKESSKSGIFNLADPFERLPSGISLLNAVYKGVSLMKDGSDVKMNVTVEVGICPFFDSEKPLTEILEGLCRKDLYNFDRRDYGYFLRLFDNVRVYSIYHKSKQYPIQHISDHTANDVRFTDRDGYPMTVAQYYSHHYGCNLQYPDLPMLEVRIPDGRVLHFPFEVLKVVSAQRVPAGKFDLIGPQFRQKINTLGAMDPVTRANGIEKVMHRIQNETLFSAFGVTLELRSNTIDYGIRHTPTVTNGHGLFSPMNKGTWKMDKYVQPAKPVKSWIILFGFDANQEDADRFAKRIMDLARRKNVIMSQPTRIVRFYSDEVDLNYWHHQFEEFKTVNPDIVFLIDSIKTDSHHKLKLCEIHHQILTQHVTVQSVRNDKTMTFENIFHKTNEKLGGLNSNIQPENIGASLHLDNNNIMVFGYDVAHPKHVPHARYQGPESLNPSVVGLSYNCADNPSNFIGDYFYQTARKESVDSKYLEDKVIVALQKWEINRKTSLPQIIFLFRDGISEGQYRMAVEEEMEVFRLACNKFSRGYNPRFVLIVATKSHIKRFFKQNYKNIDISSVIDRNVVRNTVSEFYMQSANPIKGTAKPPNFVLLSNEANYSEDEIQSFCAYLCYQHQIVAAPISLPEPVMLAHELAKRGSNNLEEWLKWNQMPRTRNGVVDTSILNGDLSYEKTTLSNQRFNA